MTNSSSIFTLSTININLLFQINDFLRNKLAKTFIFEAVDRNI